MQIATANVSAFVSSISQLRVVTSQYCRLSVLHFFVMTLMMLHVLLLVVIFVLVVQNELKLEHLTKHVYPALS